MKEILSKKAPTWTIILVPLFMAAAYFGTNAYLDHQQKTSQEFLTYTTSVVPNMAFADSLVAKPTTEEEPKANAKKKSPKKVSK